MSYVIATSDTLGRVNNLVGPFSNEDQAVKFMMDHDGFFADLETDLVKAHDPELAIDPLTVETEVLYMNAPEEMWKVRP